MRHLLITFVMIMLVNATSVAQPIYVTDSLISDFRYFIRQLEATHPDPYTNYGGRALFRREVAREVWKMNRDSITTADELCRHVNAFISPLKDGHTYLYVPGNKSNAGKSVPIEFRVINDGVIVRAIPSEYKNLIGSRLEGIESMTVDDMCDELAKMDAAENIIGNYRAVAYQGNRETILRRLIPDLPQDSVRYRLLSPEGNEMIVRLPLLSAEEIKNVRKAFQPESDAFPMYNLSYAFTDEKKQTMYFRSTSIMARDNIEAMRDMGVEYYDRLRNYYRSLQWELPEDTLKAIEGMPSFSEEFGKMLLLMKENQAKNLIIDLRGNGGGWTPITLPTLYQLWGDGFLRKNMGTKSYRILSPLYMRKINTTIDQFNKRWNTSYEFGDYTFYEDRPIASNEAGRADFIDHCMSSVKEQLRMQEGKPVYTVENIFVITDAYTFSAAFHYAFYLWKMGAKIIGVASSQAPNTYMEQTDVELPFTHVKGSISNSQQIFLPVKDERAEVFWPDYKLTYEDFKKYAFDSQAEILYLIDLLK